MTGDVDSRGRPAEYAIDRDNPSFRKIAGASAVASAPIAYVAEAIGFSAIDFDPTAFSEPGTLVALGSEGATMFWWRWRLNLFGYYLLLAPAVLALGYWLWPRDRLLVAALTAGGLTYVFLGALGTAVNAVVWPELMTEYARAGAEQQATIETVFATTADAVAVGSWGILNRTVSAVWWVGTGALLRADRPWLGRFTVLLGAVTGLAAVGALAAVQPLVGIGTIGFLALTPLWALWLGADLWRRPIDTGVHPSADAGIATTGEAR